MNSNKKKDVRYKVSSTIEDFWQEEITKDEAINYLTTLCLSEVDITLQRLFLAYGELMLWLKSEDCDCPPEGHICGRPRLERSINEVSLTLREWGYLEVAKETEG